MDNLTTLLNKKEYELVLQLSKGNDEPEALFCRISAFLHLGKAKEAMDLVEKKRDILWKASPLKCLKANFELRFILGEYDEAYSDATYFSSLPYVSQEIEEYLRSLNENIRYNERQASLKRNYSDEEIEDVLLNKDDDYETIAVLSSFNDAKTIYHSKTIVKMLNISKSNIVKTYGLMLLVKAKYPKEVTLNKNGREYKVIPSSETLPYERKEAKYVLSLVRKETKNPSLSNIAENILNNFLFEEFPNNPISEERMNIYAIALVNLSSEYLQSKLDLEPLLEKYNLDVNEVKKVEEHISEILSKADQIKV